MDGANDLKTLLFVVVPMLKPAIATMVVFCSVGYWNNYFSAMMYVSDRKLWPLTLVLRELVVEDTSSVSPVTEMLTSANRSHTFTLKMAAIIITVLPNFNRVSVYAAVLCERGVIRFGKRMIKKQLCQIRCSEEVLSRKHENQNGRRILC